VTPEELVAAACPLINEIGPAFYFRPETQAAGAELGLNAFEFYAWGRGGVLGDVEPAVIQSAFGYFSAATVRNMWEGGLGKVEARTAGRAFIACSHAFGRQHFSDLDGLAEFITAAESVADAAHPAGLALFAGLAAEPRPDDAPARAMHMATVLRELRGSVHLLAVVASGVSPKVAHYIRRPEAFGIFGYSPEDTPEVTDTHHAQLAAADVLTDALMVGPYSAVSAAQGDAMVTTLTAMKAALAG
jgi:hypothetical protein